MSSSVCIGYVRAVCAVCAQVAIADACGRHGDVRHVLVGRDNQGDSKGYAFVTFFTERGCEDTLKGLKG